MSRGRSRSWRPDRKTGGRDTRRRTIAMLILVLIGLVGFLILPFLSPDPMVRTAFMVPGDDQGVESAFSVLPATVTGTGVLETLFQDLHQRNPNRVAPAKKFTSLTELDSSVALPGQKLLLYCSLEPIVQNSGDPVLQMVGGTEDGAIIAFPDLLAKLKDLRALQIVLVMDFVRRDTGIANGRLSDDALQLLESTVLEAKIPELVVICPCQPGERQRVAVPPSRAVGGDIDGSAPNTVASPLDSAVGTNFTTALYDAFTQGRFTTARELFESIRAELATPSKLQTVRVFPAESSMLDQAFLLRAAPPSLQQEPTDKQASDDESTASTDSGEAPTVATTSPRKQREKQLSKLVVKRTALAGTGEAAAILPTKWVKLTVALARARWALLQSGDDDSSLFNNVLGDANTRLQEIEFELRGGKATNSQVSFAPWLPVATLNDDSIDSEKLDLFASVFDTIKKEPEGNLPSALRSPEVRVEFTQWIVERIAELSKTLETLPTEEKQLEKIAEFRHFLNHLPDHNWPKSDWPESLFTLDEILGQKITAEPVVTIRALNRLLQLRQKTLQCAVGLTENGSRFRRRIWNEIEGELGALLSDLTSAERWLALGVPGLRMSQKKLDRAAESWSRTNARLNDLRKTAAIPDLQQTELPFVIQFLAQQQEEVEITTTELDAAIKVADKMLKGTALTEQEFLPGVYGGTGLSVTELRAMFRLTRNMKTDVAHEDDIRDLAALNNYVARPRKNGSAGHDAHRIVSLLTTPPLSVADCEALLRQPPERLPYSAQRRTGIRLSLWSLRLLDGVSGQVHKDLWEKWKVLVKAVRDAEDTGKIISARTALATSLKNEWDQFQSLENGVTAAQLYVTRKQTSGLLAGDLAERINARSPNRVAYRQIYQDTLKGTQQLKNAESPFASESKVALVGEDNFAAVTLDGNAPQIYISQSSLVPSDSALREAGWHKLESGNGDHEVRLKAVNGHSAKETLLLVAANEKGVIFASQQLIVHPNAEAKWKVLVQSVNESDLLKDGTEFKLPPTTLTPEGKDAAVPLMFRLEKLKGVAKRVQVEVISIQVDGKETPLGTRELDFSNSKTITIPFAQTPTTTEPSSVAETKSPAPADVRGGIRLRITPDLKGASTTEIDLRPMIADVTEYVELPTLKYDQTARRLTVAVFRKRNVASLAPKTVPMEIHFNTLLGDVLKTAGSSKAELKPGRNEFSYTFSDELAARLNTRDELEFAMSVAGVPHVWRWRLEDHGAVLIAADDPQIRADLTVQESNDLKTRRIDDELLLGEKGDEVKLDIRLHIHGGQFGFSQNHTRRHELKLRIGRLNSVGPQTTIFDEDVYMRQSESIQVGPGKNGAWNFSTNTSSYEKIGYQLKSNGLGPGKYELTAELHTPNSTQLKQHRQLFTFDNSPPDFDEEDIRLGKGEFQIGREVSGRVEVREPESQIAKIEVGFDEKKMYAGSTSGQFTLPKGARGIPRISPDIKTRRTETKTLYVTVTNTAGLFRTIEKDVRFFQNANIKAKATGSVEFKFTNKRTLTAELEGTGIRKTGPSPILFTDVPVGTYKIFWKTGVGAGAGLTDSFTVESGQTAKVPPEKK